MNGEEVWVRDRKMGNSSKDNSVNLFSVFLLYSHQVGYVELPGLGTFCASDAAL